MRRSVANCSVTLLVVISLGLVLVSAQLVLPARVDSREVPYGLEDGGDPDALDGAMDEMTGLVQTPEVGAQDAAGPSCSQISQGRPSRVEPRVIWLRRERRELVLRLWFSIASLVLAF
jgi:hypothetical protein